ADYEKAGRDPHGQRQRGAGRLGGSGAARQDSLRDGRRQRGDRARGHWPGSAQAAGENEVCQPDGGFCFIKAEKVRELSEAEIDSQLRDMEAQIWKLRFQRATGQTEGLGKIRTLRKDIARSKTILRER